MNAQSRYQRRFRATTVSSNNRKYSRAIVAAVGAMGLQILPVFSGKGAVAATYTWDPSFSVNPGSGGGGNWNLNSTANWSNGSSDVQWTDNSSTGTDTAIFAGTAGTIALAGSLSAAGMVFLTDGYKITGSATITLGSGGITDTGGNVTLAPAISLVTNETWLIGSSDAVVATGPISGAGEGITLTGPGTLKLSAAESYTGSTTLDNGLLLLNFAGSGAPNNNILNKNSTLTLGGGDLQLNTSSSSVSSTQNLAGTALAPGESVITFNNTGVNPVLNLGNLSSGGVAGQAVEIASGLPMLNGSTIAAATATLTIGKVNAATIAANGLINFGTGASSVSVAGGDFLTVGLYDWAAIDPTGTFVEGGSADGTTFYTTYKASSSAVQLSTGSNADITGTFTTKGTDTPGSIRYNAAASIVTTVNGAVDTGGILVTPNVGNNNITIGGTADALTVAQAVANAGELVVFQNNTLGFLNLTTGVGTSTQSGATYTQAGAGTVELGTATNLSTYTGGTYLDNGTTEVAANGDLGAATGSTFAPVYLQGGILLANGNFALDAGGGLDPRPVSLLAQGGSIAAVTGDTLTVDGAITGTGTLFIGTGTVVGTGSGTANTTAVTGKGTVILTGGSANTYSGGTVVKNGSLRVDGTTSNTGSGAVAVNANAYLVGTGVVGSSVTVKVNGHIAPGDSGIGTITVSGLQLNSNSNLDFEFTSPNSANDMVNITNANGLSFGALNNGGADINLFQAGTTTAYDQSGTYNLIQFTNGTSLPLSTLQADLTIGNALPSNVATYTLGLNGNDLTLTINSQSINAAWNNTGSSTWANPALDATGSDTNWTGGVAPFEAGDIANFLTTPGITSPSTIDLNQSETVGTINFNNVNSYTISSQEGATLTLDSGSSGAAAVTDSGGTHTIAVPVALNKAANVTVVNSTDTLVISGAISGTTALMINPAPADGLGTVILSDPGANAGFSGPVTINSGTLQIGAGGPTGGFGTTTATMTVNGTLSYDLSGTTTLTNRLIGTGTLQQIGTGVLNVDHADSLSNMNVLNGTMQLGVVGALGNATVDVASPGVLDLNGKSPTINVLIGNGTVDNVSAGGLVALTIGNAGVTTANDTFSGSINDTTGIVGLIQAGSGTLFLSGSSSYSGGTAITAGAIKVGSNTALGTGTVGISANVFNALQLANGVNLSNTIVPKSGSGINAFEDVPDPNSTATLSGGILSTVDTRIGTSQTTSTLVLTGNSAVGGSTSGTVLARGNVVFASNANFINNGAGNPMIFGKYSSTSTLNSVIQDNAVVQSNSGVELGGNNTVNDDLSTTLTLTGNGTLNTGPGVVNLNNDSQSIASVALNLSGSSTLATSGFTFASSSGSQTIVNLSGGTIVANGNDPGGSQFFPNLSSTIQNGSLIVNVQNGGATINNNGFGITIAQALQDGGGTSDTMTFVGAGTTTLTGNGNTYAGNTTVGDGVNPTTLVVANTSGSATGTGNVILNSGTLASGAAGSISGSVIAGTGAHTIAPGGIGSVGTLSVGGLTTSSLTTISFTLGSGAGPEIANGSELILDSSSVTIGSDTALAFSGTPVSGDDYRLIGDNSSGTVVDGINLGDFSLPMAPAGLTYSLSVGVDSGYIDLVVGGGSTGPQNLVWNNAGGASPNDGQTWDISNNNNWNNGTATTVYTDGSNVTFNDANGGASYNVALNTTVRPASVTVTTANTYTISGTGTIGGTGSLTQNGTGTLILATPNTYSGGTNVSAGKLIIERTSATTSALPTGAVNITGGTLQLAQNVTAGSQSVLGPPTSNVNITSLAISGNGTLDITNNHIIIDYTPGNDPISSIVAMIESAYAGGTWTGAGITSSLLPANAGSYGIGYADSADPNNPAGLASDEIEIAYTLLGDANLDGKVNGADFTLMAANFNDAVTNGWDKGDFNYDGAVNGSDFVLLADNFNQFASQSAIDAADLQAVDSFAAANGISLSSVPEPASALVLAMGAVGLLGRRRRRE